MTKTIPTLTLTLGAVTLGIAPSTGRVTLADGTARGRTITGLRRREVRPLLTRALRSKGAEGIGAFLSQTCDRVAELGWYGDPIVTSLRELCDVKPGKGSTDRVEKALYALANPQALQFDPTPRRTNAAPGMRSVKALGKKYAPGVAGRTLPQFGHASGRLYRLLRGAVKSPEVAAQIALQLGKDAQPEQLKHAGLAPLMRMTRAIYDSDVIYGRALEGVTSLQEFIELSRDTITMIGQVAQATPDADINIGPLRELHDRLSRYTSRLKAAPQKIPSASDDTLARLDLVTTLEDGSRVGFTRARSNTEIIAAGETLNNCVSSYWQRAAQGNLHIVVAYQVRPGDTHPRALYCLEISPDARRVAQFKLNHNTRPTGEHLEIAQRYLAAAGLEPGYDISATERLDVLRAEVRAGTPAWRLDPALLGEVVPPDLIETPEGILSI